MIVHENTTNESFRAASLFAPSVIGYDASELSLDSYVFDCCIRSATGALKV